mmetsp:Transcript_119562/g.168149  ORF Transcript_119562/g.168149 Transcript_119562/m.168149 type:complete len:86 (-) Transcript_119562:379-636(-)
MGKPTSASLSAALGALSQDDCGGRVYTSCQGALGVTVNVCLRLLPSSDAGVEKFPRLPDCTRICRSSKNPFHLIDDALAPLPLLS